MRKPSLLHVLERPPVDLREPDAPITITRPAEADAPELADNGRRLALVEQAAPDSLGAIERMRFELGTTRAEMALERLQEARLEIREAMKLVDTTEDRDLHVAIGEHLIRHDALMDVIKERSS